MRFSDLGKVVAFYGRFTPTYSRTGYLARSTQWEKFRPDFSGQRWLVTGASGGIGASIVAGAAAAGASVLAVARNSQKLESMRAGLPADDAARVELLTCDLASVAAIDGLLATLRERGTRFDVLQNNVGVLFNEQETTGEGFEATYVTNLLGHYQLTEGMLNNSLLADDATIVNMASGGLYNVPLNTKLLNVLDPARYSGKLAYAAHKRAQTELSERWDQRLRESGGRSYLMHPGWVRTEGVRQALPVFYKIQGVILRTGAEGADTALWLSASRPEASGRTIWFDRGERPQHMFAATREAKCTPQDIVTLLENDLSRARGETTG